MITNRGELRFIWVLFALLIGGIGEPNLNAQVVELKVAKTIEFIVEQPLALGGATNIGLYWAFNTKDGGFVEVRGDGGPYYSLSKFGAGGSLVWSMAVSNSVFSSVFGDSFIEDHDGNVVFILNAGFGGNLICRVDTNGAILDQAPLGTQESRVVLSGDGFLVGGVLSGNGLPSFIRLNASFQRETGSTIGMPSGSWTRGSSYGHERRFILPERNGSIIYAGKCDLRQITKLDTNGNVTWDLRGISNDSTFRPGGVPGGSDLMTIIRARDGGFLMAGFDMVNANGDSVPGNFDYLLVKISSTGQVMWLRRYGGSRHEFLSSVVQTEDGGFLVSGFSETEGVDGNKGVGGVGFWLVKTDERGLKQSEVVIQNEADWGNYLLSTPSGFTLLGVNAKQVQPTRWDLTVPRRVKVSAHNPSGLPYRVDVSGDLEHWSPVVIGFSGDLELRENVGATPRYWRAYSTP